MKTHIAALALLTALPAAAADPATSLDRLLACADIADAAPRLECFDRSVAAVRAPATSAATVVAAAPATSSAPAPEPLTVTAPAPAPASLAEARPSETAAVVQARIVASGKSSGGLYYVTLDNGQTWRHESGSMEPYLKVGEAVTISKGSLGSHRLTLDSSKSKNWVRVTRQR